MSTPPEERRVRLKALVERYCHEAHERLSAIREAFAAFKAGDLEALRVLCLHSHSLLGSGATMGFPAISDAARPLEDAARPFVARLETLEGTPPELIKSIDADLPALEKAIAGMEAEEGVERLIEEMMHARQSL